MRTAFRFRALVGKQGAEFLEFGLSALRERRTGSGSDGSAFQTVKVHGVGLPIEPDMPDLPLFRWTRILALSIAILASGAFDNRWMLSLYAITAISSTRCAIVRAASGFLWMGVTEL